MSHEQKPEFAEALRNFTRRCSHDGNSSSSASIRLVKSDPRVSCAYCRVYSAGPEGLRKLTAAFSWLFNPHAGVQEVEAVCKCV